MWLAAGLIESICLTAVAMARGNGQKSNDKWNHHAVKINTLVFISAKNYQVTYETRKTFSWTTVGV
jgi:hypothetical protein